MELWHLDYRKSTERGAEKHLGVVFSQDADAAASNAAEAFALGLYDKVAIIDDGMDPGRAYMLTQHQDEGMWHELRPDGVQPAGDGPFRSSTNGDLLVIDGRPSVMSAYGLLPLPL